MFFPTLLHKRMTWTPSLDLAAWGVGVFLPGGSVEDGEFEKNMDAFHGWVHRKHQHFVGQLEYSNHHFYWVTCFSHKTDFLLIKSYKISILADQIHINHPFSSWRPHVLPVKSRFRFEPEVADAVRYVHAQKMVHRDVWPNCNELSKDSRMWGDSMEV